MVLKMTEHSVTRTTEHSVTRTTEHSMMETLRLTCHSGRSDKFSLAAARIDDVLLHKKTGDLDHCVKGTLEDLLGPITDELTSRLRHLLLVGLHQLRQLRLHGRTALITTDSHFCT